MVCPSIPTMSLSDDGLGLLERAAAGDDPGNTEAEHIAASVRVGPDKASGGE
jgi:hypothetical protein